MQCISFSREGRIAICMAIIVAAILAVYGSLVEHPFHAFDDPIYVTNNYYVQQGITVEGFAWAFRSMDGANWHPLTWLSHMLDIEIFGPKPAGHYLTNILLHGTASLLLFWLVRKIALHDWMALAIALIWAVHPANVECVAWISQRKSLLSANLIFAGMIFYARYKQGGHRYDYLLCVVVQLLASMAKPIAVIFPIVLVLMDGLDTTRVSDIFVDWNRPFIQSLLRGVKVLSRRMIDKIPFILIAGYLSVVTFIAQDKAGATGYTYRTTLIARCENALESMLDYTIKALTMPETSVLYILRPLNGLRVFYGALLVLLLILAAVAAVKKMRPVTIGIAWYLLMFLPTIGLVQVGSQRLADRYLHLPVIGLIVALCYCIFLIFRSLKTRLLAAFVMAAWAVGLGFQARALCINWADELRLSQNGIAVGGRSTSLVINCAVVAMQHGQYVSARTYLNEVGGERKGIQNTMVIDLFEKKYEDVIRKAKYLYADKDSRLSAAVMTANAFELMGKHSDATRAYKAAINFLPKERSYLLSVEQFKVVLPAAAAASEQREKDQNTIKSAPAVMGEK